MTTRRQRTRIAHSSRRTRGRQIEAFAFSAFFLACGALLAPCSWVITHVDLADVADANGFAAVATGLLALNVGTFVVSAVMAWAGFAEGAR